MNTSLDTDAEVSDKGANDDGPILEDNSLDDEMFSLLGSAGNFNFLLLLTGISSTHLIVRFGLISYLILFSEVFFLPNYFFPHNLLPKYYNNNYNDIL